MPVEVEAHQWFKNGDHPDDDCAGYSVIEQCHIVGEGKVVRYYRPPSMDGKSTCDQCGIQLHNHGWIDTLEGGHIVCPGDWIITGIMGERYPCKDAIFKESYERI